MAIQRVDPKKLDKASHNPGTLQAALADLQDPNKDLATIAKQHLQLTDLERQHLAADWFDDATRWWRNDIANPGPVVRRGFIEAINLALNPNTNGLSLDGSELTPPQQPPSHLPLDSYWVCQRGGAARNVSVGIGWSFQQVTVLIHTPHPGAPSIPNVPATVPEPIIVVKLDDSGQAVPTQPKHRP